MATEHYRGAPAPINPPHGGHESADVSADAGLDHPVAYDNSDRFECIATGQWTGSYQLEAAYDCLQGIDAIADLLRCSAAENFDFENADPGSDEQRLARPFSQRATEGLHIALRVLALEAMGKVSKAADLLASERGAA